MRGVGPGTVLGGRYAVHRRLEQRRDTERWSADDTTLGRRVSVLVIGADDGRTPDLLDAARRAASVTHAVFVRILDVGSDDEVSYVVEEDLSEARTLTDLVTDGGVPGDEVRRITGEVAAALETARQRGMHHLELEPDDVLRTPEGEIRLRGLETAAVRAGHEGAEPDDAARRDAVGVVALAYAGLTGLWPLGAGGSGLGAAPRVPGGVAAPSEIAAGVPRDLDAICRLTINDDQGPTSPGDFARQVAPWPSRQVVGRPVVPTVVPPRPETLDAQAEDDAPVDVEEPSARRAGRTLDEAEPVDEPESVDEPEPYDEADEVTHVLPRVVGAGGRGARSPTSRAGATLGDEHRRRGGRGPGVRADPRHRAPPDPRRHPGRLGRGACAPVGGDVRHDETAADGAADDADQADGDDEQRRGAGAGAAAAGAAAVAALGSVGGRVGGLARRAVDKVSELSPDTASTPREPRAARSTAAGSDLEPPAPLVPAEPLTKDESKLALGHRRRLPRARPRHRHLGRLPDRGEHRHRARRQHGLLAHDLGRAVLGGTERQRLPRRLGGDPEPLAILKVEAYDPGGDGEENNQLTPKTYDGDKGDGWFSENYRSDEFGGLKKGLGVIVDLGPNKKPQGVELTVPVAADLEVYVGPDNRLEGATKIGDEEGRRGHRHVRRPRRRQRPVHRRLVHQAQPGRPREAPGVAQRGRRHRLTPAPRWPTTSSSSATATSWPGTSPATVARPSARSSGGTATGCTPWPCARRRNRELAADAVQEAFISAFRRADAYRGEAAVTTWLHRIVVNACLDRIRRERVTVRRAGDVAELDLPDRHDHHASVEARLDVREALAQDPRGAAPGPRPRRHARAARSPRPRASSGWPREP